MVYLFAQNAVYAMSNLKYKFFYSFFGYWRFSSPATFVHTIIYYVNEGCPIVVVLTNRRRSHFFDRFASGQKR